MKIHAIYYSMAANTSSAFVCNESLSPYFLEQAKYHIQIKYELFNLHSIVIMEKDSFAMEFKHTGE